MNDPIFDVERRSSLDNVTEEEWNDYHRKSLEVNSYLCIGVDKMAQEKKLADQPIIQRKMGESISGGFAKLPEGNSFESVNDSVNHPSHYTNRKMEAIDIIEMIIETEKNSKVAYNMSNVLKYLLRFRDKGKPIEDLKKAQWYLNRMIEKVGEGDQ